MIYDGLTLPPQGTMEADLCVVGAGPGGLTAATMAAEAGLRVVLLEAGELVTPAMSNQREEDMLPRLLWLAGARTTADKAVRVVQGHGVGGSSLHNLNLCKRIPAQLRSKWALERKLSHLGLEAWDGLYDEVEKLLGVSAVAPGRWSRHNLLLKKGVEALGWRGGGLSHNRTGCVGSGFCEVGCSFDAKNNALKVFAPRFVAAGGVLVTRAQAVHVLHEAGAVTGVEAALIHPRGWHQRGRLVVNARRVCVSASATGSAALLLRSGVPDASGTTGATLRIHPAVMVAGEFAEPVEAWKGIPQTYECTEHLRFDGSDKRLWVVPAFGHPVAVATLVPGHGAEHRRVMERYAHLGAFTAMLHDHTAGTVKPDGPLGLQIDYWPDAADRRQLSAGLEHCARLLFAAGATRVLVPGHPVRVLTKISEVDALSDYVIARGAIDLSAVHPMASVGMSDDPSVGPVDSQGCHHGLRGLWVADGSLFPESIGVPPQVSIYAMGLHVGRAIAGAQI
jgi:choline dehydrogenase-like flavoprotein